MTYVIMRMVRTRLALSVFLILVWTMARPASIWGQYQKYEGKEIVNIQFSPPEQPVEAMELFEILPIKRGEPLHIAQVRAAIDRLFATGRYADIQVDAEPYLNGIILRFVSRWSGAISKSETGLPFNPWKAGMARPTASLPN